MPERKDCLLPNGLASLKRGSRRLGVRAGHGARAEEIALTRLRVELRDSAKMNEAALTKAGVLGVWRLSGSTMHLIVGEDAAALASAIAVALEESRGRSARSST